MFSGVFMTMFLIDLSKKIENIVIFVNIEGRTGKDKLIIPFESFVLFKRDIALAIQTNAIV